MRRSKRPRRSLSQILFWLFSLIIVASMVVSLVIVALPAPPTPTVTPWPTWPLPTRVPPTPLPTAEPSPSAMPAGPVLPTNTPTVTPTLTATPVPPLARASTTSEPITGPAVLTVTQGISTSAVAGGNPSAQDTSSITKTAFTFAVAGDSRGNPVQYRKLLEAVMADGSEFLIHTGDLVNKGSEAEWQAFLAPMEGFSLPFYPVPGNHDALDGKLDGYLKYSGAPAAHYAFDRGPVHFALVDSHNGGVTGDELAWLRQDLSATNQPVKMVVLHHPPFDPDGTDHIMAFGNEAFMALMVEQGVDYVFAGHIHAYAQGEREGVIYTITGGGGAPLYRSGHPQAFYHYLRLTIQGEKVTIEAVKL